MFRRGTTLVVISGCILLTVFTNVLGAQSARAVYQVSGQVSGQGGDAVPGAEVRFTSPDGVTRVAHTDSTGRYALANLAAAAGTLRVRHFGFEPKEIEVNVTRADHAATVDVELQVMARRLDAIETTADSVLMEDPRLRAFEERAESNGFGHYVRPNRIADLRPTNTSEALRGLPGVELRPSRRFGNDVRIRGCMPLVWVDGVRTPGAELDEVTLANEVAAIEVYNSLAGVPAQYADRTATCGTILVWLKPR